ncbi:hypothetical protein P170DRAFT_6786 [Aspergillus steynii IBT 23096]|uniref:Uncharacterized protein n=1 Tax=Aspergillus steynii IBT 23096 TaxID=1392250 RepID=A0A2I2GM76_9EURO|nr:uncharacterized protein P170DRAFT_6786 [Aspergillus steynii IBT 23096]PLB53977.1 hypothetical protein P170DRAFT_6786 [Aspergillus steynii IBT 23096]
MLLTKKHHRPRIVNKGRREYLSFVNQGSVCWFLPCWIRLCGCTYPVARNGNEADRYRSRIPYFDNKPHFFASILCLVFLESSPAIDS